MLFDLSALSNFSPYLVIAYKNGRISLYHYETHEMINSDILPEASTKLPEKETDEFEIADERPSFQQVVRSVTTIKYSPKCKFHSYNDDIS